jgi:subtilisin family serine protease
MNQSAVLTAVVTLVMFFACFARNVIVFRQFPVFNATQLNKMSFEDRGKLVYQRLKMASLVQDKFLNKFTKPYQSLWISNAIVTEEDIKFEKHELNDILEVYKYAEVKRQVINPIFSQKTTVGWNVDRAKGPALWNIGNKGDPTITVGNIDTGVFSSHTGLSPKYRGTIPGSFPDHNYNWWDGVRSGQNAYCTAPTSAPCDDYGHGTHTMGTMVGSMADAHVGIAPNVNWIACRGFDQGMIVAGAIEGCLQFMLAPTKLDGSLPNTDKRPNVLSHSYGVPDTVILQRAFSSLDSAGVLNVAAIGNMGTCGTSIAPATYPFVITVSSSDSTDLVSSYSTKGPSGVAMKPDIIAPGSNVLSYSNNGGTATLSGTSMSSPLVAGGLVLVMSNVVGLRDRPDIARQFLLNATNRVDATDCGSPTSFPNYVYGYGLLDVYNTFLIANQSMKCGNSFYFDKNACSGNGTCVLSGKCKCNFGNFGLFCEQVSYCFGLPFWSPKVCSGFGACNGTCVCVNGASGSQCEIRSTPQSSALIANLSIVSLGIVVLFLTVF